MGAPRALLEALNLPRRGIGYESAHAPYLRGGVDDERVCGRAAAATATAPLSAASILPRALRARGGAEAAPWPRGGRGARPRAEASARAVVDVRERARRRRRSRVARGGSAACETVFSWARGRGGAAWPALLDGGGPAAVAVARCLGGLAAAAAREAARPSSTPSLTSRPTNGSSARWSGASSRPTALPARRPRSMSVASRGSLVPRRADRRLRRRRRRYAWDGLRHAAAANATVEPFVGAIRALAAVAPGDFYGGLLDHALDLLSTPSGSSPRRRALARHPAGRSDGDVAALELVAVAAPSRGRGALARIAAVVAAPLRLGTAGPARLAEWLSSRPSAPRPRRRAGLRGRPRGRRGAPRARRRGARRGPRRPRRGARRGGGGRRAEARAAVAALRRVDGRLGGGHGARARGVCGFRRRLLPGAARRAGLARGSAPRVGGLASGAAACYEALVGGAGGARAVAWFAGAVRAAPPDATPQRVAAGLLGDLGG